ncbi:hypothetical protein MAN_06683, partial [Metarhizium hybridum]
MAGTASTVARELYQGAFRHIARLGHLPAKSRYTRPSAIRLNGSDEAYSDLEEVLRIGNVKLVNMNKVSPQALLFASHKLGANIGDIVKATVSKRSSIPFKTASVDWAVLLRKI